jgi:hypothetical protein
LIGPELCGPPHFSTQGKEADVRLTKIVLISIITVVTGLALFAEESKDLTWPQWWQNSQHQAFVNIEGHQILSQLGDVVYDPLVPQEQAFSFGELLAPHHQVPILDGDGKICTQNAGHLFVLGEVAGSWIREQVYETP